MAMNTSSGGGGVTSDINVTPMIDVLLVLLIIFMVVNAMSRTVTEVQIPPKETAAATSTPTAQIVLELLADGNYSINAQPGFPKEQLDAQIHSIYDNRPAKLIFVKPAGTRTYGQVIEAIDIVRGAGVEVVGFTPIEAN
ncbi:MAG TPA: biopolymer transporter ExbD [Gemmatimonadales bacterium]|nr:biopolymer transporter ExbD [Gemmatimonadales bacterium]